MRVTTSLLALVLILIPSAASSVGVSLGKLSLSFSDNDQIDQITVQPNQAFSFYINVGLDFGDIGDPSRNVFDGIKAWEACVVLPPEVNVTDRIIHHASFGGAPPTCGDNWILVLDRCLVAQDTPTVLIEYEAMISADLENIPISMMAADPSSFGGTAPGWAQCVIQNPDEDTHPFDPAWSAPIVINENVAADLASWSALKARY